MVHNFDKYFVSVEPKLAKKIPDPTTAGNLNETLISRLIGARNESGIR